jgi:hypothetical protein
MGELTKSQARTLSEHIKNEFGNEEEFFQQMVEGFPEVLEGNVNEALCQKIASGMGMTLAMVTRYFRSPRFNTMLDLYITMEEYGPNMRREAVKQLAEIATTSSKVVMSKRGQPIEVDRDAKEIVIADEYLRALQGRSPQTDKANGGGRGGATVIINFGTAADIVQDAEDDKTITVSPYRPNKAGELPPPMARPHYGQGTGDGNDKKPIPSEIDFTGELIGGKAQDSRKNFTNGLIPNGAGVGGK